MSNNKNDLTKLPAELFEDLPPTLLADGLELQVSEPVDLAHRNIRTEKRSLHDITLDLLNTELDNGDSRAEIVLDALVKKAQEGNIRATELIIKLLHEFDDKAEINVKIPEINITTSDDKTGIRFQEKDIQEKDINNSK